jgi:hypothetical protein
MEPVPPQAVQVRATLKKPCWKRTWPRPPQVEQVAGSAPPRVPRPRQA